MHLKKVDSDRTRKILHCKIYLLEQDSYPDNVSFQNTYITLNDYDMFRTHHDALAILSQSGHIKLSTPRSIMYPTALAHQFTLDDIFKKIIKRDSQIFFNFKDVKFWDNWRKITIDTSNAQDVAIVLEQDYSPTSPEEIALFHEKQKFMHSVFNKVPHTEVGKKYVREY